VGKLIAALNYGTIDVDWNAPDPRITLRVRDDRDAARIERTIRLSELQRKP
jgi:hypothetical protein